MEPYIETDCTFEHDGIKFTSGGAVVADDYLIAYPAKGGILTDWHGRHIGTWTVTASWQVRSHWNPRMYQIRATVNGRVYTGRGMGEGMIYRGRPVKGRS